MVDEGSQFRKTFAELAALHDVNLQKTPVECTTASESVKDTTNR